VPDGLDGLLRARKIADVHLLAFKYLVVLEEALQLGHPVLGELLEVLEGPVLRVVEVDADDLLVVLSLVHHVHHPYRARPQDAKRLDRLLHDDEHVERVIIVAEGTRDEAVVRV
jgi:hypothetical protein